MNNGGNNVIRLGFTDSGELLEFLTTTKDFEGWETVIFRLYAENGIKMDLQTQVNDNMGLSQYLEFNKLKNTLINFFNQNGHLTINIEIKLKFPDNQRKIMDSNNAYSAFYFNIYTDAQTTFATTSFLETSRTLTPNPIISWGVYITSIYNEWRRKRGDY